MFSEEIKCQGRKPDCMNLISTKKSHFNSIYCWKSKKKKYIPRKVVWQTMWTSFYARFPFRVFTKWIREVFLWIQRLNWDWLEQGGLSIPHKEELPPSISTICSGFFNTWVAKINPELKKTFTGVCPTSPGCSNSYLFSICLKLSLQIVYV